MTRTTFTDMQTIIADWKANAERHSDRNVAFLRSLKMKNERAVDRAARELHDEAFSIIDCIQCANCCKTVSLLFLKDDIRRIAEHMGMTVADFNATYLRPDEDDDLCLKALPCPFLAEDGRCTIYEVRPKDCAEYPHTQKEEFATRTHLHAGNALSCPAVFWIGEQLRARRLRQGQGNAGANDDMKVASWDGSCTAFTSACVLASLPTALRRTPSHRPGGRISHL